jgi:hypothetical protein
MPPSAPMATENISSVRGRFSSLFADSFCTKLIFVRKTHVLEGEDVQSIGTSFWVVCGEEVVPIWSKGEDNVAFRVAFPILILCGLCHNLIISVETRHGQDRE